MADHVFLVFTNPTEGLEDEYNDWYTNLHLDEVTAIPGFGSVRRYALCESQLDGFDKPKHRYLAMYEISGDPGNAFAAMQDALESSRMQLPESLSTTDLVPLCFTPITDWVRSKTQTGNSDHTFFVLTNPTTGLEDEYNDWYTNVHLDEVTSVKGFISARRYGLSDSQLAGFGESEHRYLAVYEISGDPSDAFADMTAALEDGRIQLVESLSISDLSPLCFTPITGWVGMRSETLVGGAVPG